MPPRADTELTRACNWALTQNASASALFLPADVSSTCADTWVGWRAKNVQIQVRPGDAGRLEP
eukprot:5705513-Alexandrium_andersonii.AAC.1